MTSVRLALVLVVLATVSPAAAAPEVVARAGGRELLIEALDGVGTTCSAAVVEVATRRVLWEGWVVYPAPSPDGMRLAFREFTPAHGPQDGHIAYRLLDLARAAEPELLHPPADDEDCHYLASPPAWRADGGAVALSTRSATARTASSESSVAR